MDSTLSCRNDIIFKGRASIDELLNNFIRGRFREFAYRGQNRVEAEIRMERMLKLESLGELEC